MSTRPSAGPSTESNPLEEAAAPYARHRMLASSRVRALSVLPIMPSSLDALDSILGRHSVGPKYLVDPGPTEAQLQRAFAAALRAPDHGKLIPYRFVVARDEGLERLAELFVDYGRRHAKSEAELALERRRAVQAPVVVGVVARIDSQHEVPAHEQWIAVGGALTNVLNALHLQGFGAKMLSGHRARDARIGAAFCRDGEQLVGWISTGTATSAPKARRLDDATCIVSRF